MEDIEERLIVLITKHRCLYDQSSAEFKDQVMKDNAWRAIGQELNRDGSWACKRFKYLRDTYTRKKRELKTKSGQEATRITKWRFFALMGFLDPFSKYQTTEGNFVDNGESTPDDFDDEDEDEDHDAPPSTYDFAGITAMPSSGRQTPVSDVTPSSSSRQLTETPVVKKRRQAACIVQNERLEMLDAFKKSSEAILNRKPKDESEVWAESVGMRLITMGPRQRSLVRLRVEQILFDVEYGSGNCSNQQQSSIESPCFAQQSGQYSDYVSVPLSDIAACLSSSSGVLYNLEPFNTV